MSDFWVLLGLLLATPILLYFCVKLCVFAFYRAKYQAERMNEREPK